MRTSFVTQSPESRLGALCCLRFVSGKQCFSVSGTILLYTTSIGAVLASTLWYFMRFHWRATNSFLLDFAHHLRHTPLPDLSPAYWQLHHFSIAGGVPYAILAMLLIMLAVFLVMRRLHIVRRRITSLSCLYCGYRMSCSDSNICPECGATKYKPNYLHCGSSSPLKKRGFMRRAAPGGLWAEKADERFAHVSESSDRARRRSHASHNAPMQQKARPKGRD